MRILLRTCFVAVALLILSLAGAGVAIAADAVIFTKKGASYEDVRADLENAILAEGLVIDLKGNVGAMLERTGRDVGSNVPIYNKAEYFVFCSARLSRAMMEADPANMSQCPYVMFVYQRVATGSEVVVGYRKVIEKGRGAKALAEVNAMLERIARKAVE
jgi:uncharacterized protein (DUF302 family)